MSNLGLLAAMKQAGINVEITQVGDRYVIERMREKNINLGGEQSGHLIFLDYATTGDGIISALHVLRLMKQKGRSLRDMADFMEEYPQKLASIPVKAKIPLADLPLLTSTMTEAEKALNGAGRINVRYSGTENKIRVLVEARSVSDVEYWQKKLTDAVNKELC